MTVEKGFAPFLKLVMRPSDPSCSRMLPAQRIWSQPERRLLNRSSVNRSRNGRRSK